LTRRAKHWQNGIVETSLFVPAPDIPPRFFYVDSGLILTEIIMGFIQ